MSINKIQTFLTILTHGGVSLKQVRHAIHNSAIIAVFDSGILDIDVSTAV